MYKYTIKSRKSIRLRVEKCKRGNGRASVIEAVVVLQTEDARSILVQSVACYDKLPYVLRCAVEGECSASEE